MKYVDAAKTWLSRYIHVYVYTKGKGRQDANYI